MRHLFIVTLLMCSASATASTCSPLLNRTLTTLQGETINLCQYAGQPILVVNTASKCGYTGQFEKLEAIYSQYQAQGLLVVGFPSHDFHQELSNNGEIAKFCKLTYKVKFPMSEPSSVTGKAANPFFKALAKRTGQEPQWNFHKYLIAPDGETVYSFATQTEPDSGEIMGKIKAMLK